MLTNIYQLREVVRVERSSNVNGIPAITSFTGVIVEIRYHISSNNEECIYYNVVPAEKCKCEELPAGAAVDQLEIKESLGHSFSFFNGGFVPHTKEAAKKEILSKLNDF